MTGGRVDQVDHRAVRVEQAGRLGDRGDEQVVDLAVTAVGIPAEPAGTAAGRGLGWRRRDGVGRRVGGVGRGGVDGLRAGARGRRGARVGEVTGRG